MDKTVDLEKYDSFFLAGCSWGCVYYIGVYEGLLKIYGNKLYEKKIGGNSSGALMALGILCKISPSDLLDIYKKLYTDAQKGGVFGKMSKYQTEAILNMLDKDSYKKLSGKLHIGITLFPSKYKLVSKWESNKELIDTLHASFHIPFYSTYIDPTKYGIGIDGGFGNDFTKITENTVIINATSNKMEILKESFLNILVYLGLKIVKRFTI